VSGPAEVVAAIAGLGGPPPAGGGPLTPQVLIDTYCQPPADEESRTGAWRSEQRADSMFNAGFCGFDGRQGFDEGHDWISELAESGWCPLPGLGEWPLVAFAFWPALPSDPRWAIAHYCEGDMAVEVFTDHHAANKGYTCLRRGRPA
jgi:hypothetical protein